VRRERQFLLSHQHIIGLTEQDQAFFDLGVRHFTLLYSAPPTWWRFTYTETAPVSPVNRSEQCYRHFVVNHQSTKQASEFLLKMGIPTPSVNDSFLTVLVLMARLRAAPKA
jgi:hypothetical protein